MKTISLTILILSILACGSAGSNDNRAESIPSPMSGYKCFVIISDGKSVGGNCVKE